MILKNINNIIFDLGGVLLNLDISRTEQAFRKLGMPDLRVIYSQAKQSGLFDDFETGRISSAEFRKEMRKWLHASVTDEQINGAWNAMLLDLPVQRLQLLDELKKQFNLFLLSNTNEIHMAAYAKYLQNAYGFADLSHIFVKEYLSYKIKMRKPHAEVFELVIKENELKEEETLFIDDTLHHIEGAQRLGIKSLWLEKGKTILEIFGGRPLAIR